MPGTQTRTHPHGDPPRRLAWLTPECVCGFGSCGRRGHLAPGGCVSFSDVRYLDNGIYQFYQLPTLKVGTVDVRIWISAFD